MVWCLLGGCREPFTPPWSICIYDTGCPAWKLMAALSLSPLSFRQVVQHCQNVPVAVTSCPRSIPDLPEWWRQISLWLTASQPFWTQCHAQWMQSMLPVLAPLYGEQASHLQDPIQQLAPMCTLQLTRHLEEAGWDPHIIGNAALIATTGLPADAVHLQLRVILLLCQGLCQKGPVEAPDRGGHLHGAALQHGAAQGDAAPHALAHILEGWLHHRGDWRPNRATDEDAVRVQPSHSAWPWHCLWEDRHLWFPRGYLFSSKSQVSSKQKQ